MTFDGGQKSIDHVKGQIRLVNLFTHFNYGAREEYPLPCKGTLGDLFQFQTDVAIFGKGWPSHVIMALEVDEMGQNTDMSKKSNKHKSLPVTISRDRLITETYHIPVIRYEVTELILSKKKRWRFMFMDDLAVIDRALNIYRAFIMLR